MCSNLRKFLNQLVNGICAHCGMHADEIDSVYFMLINTTLQQRAYNHSIKLILSTVDKIQYSD